MTGVRFNPLAEQELLEAIQYYEEQSSGLGAKFSAEVERSLTFLRRYPEAAPRILGSIRRFVLPLFPYYLLYRPLKSGDLRILAVGHQKRHPRYWRRRT
ncbi:MAG: type II toxin-antitoxin system RelE/ParE family toxin [Acidobacteria bacterium]|nr:type II toxin-antitoxin system RelE/ParE family toxin [Acidobacteriota bacterium]